MTKAGLPWIWPTSAVTTPRRSLGRRAHIMPACVGPSANRPPRHEDDEEDEEPCCQQVVHPVPGRLRRVPGVKDQEGQITAGGDQQGCVRGEPGVLADEPGEKEEGPRQLRVVPPVPWSPRRVPAAPGHRHEVGDNK